jgi:tRNA A-37 threonylcarbamoyl transferase component Bud32
VRDPLRDRVRALATQWAPSHSLRGGQRWWYFEPLVDRPFRRQGWKLHVSAVPVSCVRTLDLVAGIVMPKGLRWKVTRSVGGLVDLCSPPIPVPQVGKFITVYVEEREDVAGLAAELDAVTAFYDGPVIPSDQRYVRGSNVYLRYGSFEATTGYAREDQTQIDVLIDPAGMTSRDERAPGRAFPVWISEPPVPPAPPVHRPGTGLFGRGIDIIGHFSQSAKGGVYKALIGGRPVVIKEARIGTVPDLIGRDSRDRLLNEWRILQRLKGSGVAAEPLDFFFEEGNAYLVEEPVPGRTLREIVEDVNYGGATDPDSLRDIVPSLRELAARAGELGVWVRDLSPNNVMVDGDRCTLIDLELAQLSDSSEPPFRGRTLGYAAEDDDNRTPAVTVSYALAAISFYVLTGIHPVLAQSEPIAPHVDAVLPAFGPSTGLPADAERIRRHLSPPTTASSPHPAGHDVLTGAILAGEQLARRVEWDRQGWPWPQAWSPGLMHPASFMGGTLGVVQFYLDLWQASKERCWIERADELLEWTYDSFPFVDGHSPPGLYMGLGSMPWLMAELATVADGSRAATWRQRSGDLAAELATAHVVSHDVTHGWAGIMLAQLAVSYLTGADACRAAAARIMRLLIRRAGNTNGLPTWTAFGRRFYGFAHGSAGIGYALLAGGRATQNTEGAELAVEVGSALLEHGLPTVNGRGLSWPREPGATATPWTHWCNGAAGVGVFLLALWTATGDQRFLDGAVRAGRTITLARPFTSCCRCHGLAGDGDFLLDLACATGREEFAGGAEQIRRKLDALRMLRDGVPVWPHEGNGEPRPGFMRGYTGAYSFLLRQAGYLNAGPLMVPIVTQR